jgi:hypothetical protein
MLEKGLFPKIKGESEMPLKDNIPDNHNLSVDWNAQKNFEPCVRIHDSNLQEENLKPDDASIDSTHLNGKLISNSFTNKLISNTFINPKIVQPLPKIAYVLDSSSDLSSLSSLSPLRLDSSKSNLSSSQSLDGDGFDFSSLPNFPVLKVDVILNKELSKSPSENSIELSLENIKRKWLNHTYHSGRVPKNFFSYIKGGNFLLSQTPIPVDTKTFYNSASPHIFPHSIPPSPSISLPLPLVSYSSSSPAEYDYGVFY